MTAQNGDDDYVIAILLSFNEFGRSGQDGPPIVGGALVNQKGRSGEAGDDLGTLL